MNATRETEIIELGDGNEYTVSAFGLMELEVLETFLQGRVMQAGRASLPTDIEPAEAERMMQPVIAYAMTLSIMDDDGYSKLLNFSGITRLIYYSLKREHPDIKLEKCRDFVNNVEYVTKFMDCIARVNKLQYQPKQKHREGSQEQASRPLGDSCDPKQNVRNATKRNRRAESKPVSGVSESNGAG